MTNLRSATTSVSKRVLLLFFCDTYLLHYEYSEIHNIGDRATKLDFGIAPTSFSNITFFVKMTKTNSKMAKM
jgi:hypothetical protein